MLTPPLLLHDIIEPGPVSDLMCSSTDSSDLMITWARPELNPGNAIDYLVEVLQYVQPEGSEEVELVDLSPPFNKQVDGLQTKVDEAGLLTNTNVVRLSGYYFLPLVGGVRYVVTVMPRNPAGCGVPANLSCYSRELRKYPSYPLVSLVHLPSPSAVPIGPVGNVQAVRSSSDTTTITVSWEPLTIVEAHGFIQYLVVLTPSASSKRQTLSMQVAMDRSSVAFTGLDPSQAYEVSVATVTSDGIVGQSE